MNLDTRLDQLEAKFKAEQESGLWVDMVDNVVRLDVGRRRGKENTFPSSFDAARWVEKQIDNHGSAYGSIIVHNICELYEKSDQLKEVVQMFLPGTVKTTYGEFSAESLCGTVVGNIKTFQPASLNLWLLANVIEQYFSLHEFKQRYLADSFTDDDIQIYWALFAVFQHGQSGDLDNIRSAYERLIRQVAKLPHRN